MAAGRETAGAWADAGNVALLADLYELTMAQAYLAEGLSGPAVFSLFARRLPRGRNYLVAAGLEDALRALESLRFGTAALNWLASLRLFDDRLLAWLEGYRFSGDVEAMPEGTPLFAGEPLLEVTAPIAEAQLVETLLMNQVHLQTLAASKAARVVEAARGRTVVDFGARRMHGVDAAVKVARAAFLAGCDSTSNVLAGHLYGIPLAGTMAHSWVQAHDSEIESFRSFARTWPTTVLLVDTYDTLAGVREVVRLARELGPGFRVRAVRLDSGDLLELSRAARRILDEAGLPTVGIFASGGLDERAVDRLVRAGAPIGGFGVGTSMGVSEDAPALDVAYKLVSYDGRERLKLSTGKELWPGPKQVFRVEREGKAERDVLARRAEALPGRPLLVPAMRGGRRLPGPTLGEAREHARRERERLPERLLSLDPSDPPYPVEPSEGLVALRDRLAAEHRPAR